MMRRRGGSAALRVIAPLLAASVAWSGPAWAQAAAPAAAASPDAGQEADAHFLRGKALLKAGKRQEAREAYLAAWALKKSYDVAGNLGSLEVQLGLFRDGAEHMAFAVRHYATTGTTPEQLKRAKERLAEAKKHVAAITVTVSVAGAEVLVDGASVGRAPLDGEVFVDPGARVIEARLHGYAAAQETVQAEKGGEQSVTLTLTPVALPVATPAAPREVKEDAGGTAAVAPHAWRPGVEMIVAGGALAAVGLGVGLGLTAAANGRSADASALRIELGSSSRCAGQPAAAVAGPCEALREAVADRDTLSNGALVSFVAAGAFALGTAGLAVWRGSTRAQEGVSVVPVVGAGRGGAVVEGRW